MPRIMGSGVAAFDGDGDGDLDLYFVQGRGPDELWMGSGDGRFERGAPLAENPAYGMGVAVGDLDGDGDLDLIRTGFGAATLLRNEDDLAFLPAAGLPETPGWSASATTCDYDGDGQLDLFLTRYMDYDPEFTCHAATGAEDYCNPTEIPGLSDRLYRNLGDGRFEDRSRAAGIAAFAARGLGVVCHDVTGDGRPDFYVANDTEANHLWVNQGDGGFREEALLLGAALSGFGRPEAGMGIGLGDFDGDEDLDLLLTHFANETNTLYLAEPGIGFEDASIRFGLGRLGLSTTGFGVMAGDFDLDGRLDAVIANGRVARPTGEPPREPHFEQYAEPLLLLAGTGAGLRDAGPESPDLMDLLTVGRGLVAGDLDGDGDLDLVATAAEAPASILRNDSTRAGGWLTVLPLTGDPIRPDHGATVRLATDRDVRIAPANPGVSYLSSSDPAAHFGLPAGVRITAVTVVWSDGEAETFPAPEPNRRVELLRGAGSPVPPSISGGLDVRLGEVIPLEQQRLPAHVGEGVGEAVSEVEGGGVVPLAEPPPRVPGRDEVSECHGNEFDLHLPEVVLGVHPGYRPASPLNDQRDLQRVSDRHAGTGRCMADRLMEAVRLRFLREDRENRRTVHNHLGNPRSSYSQSP